MATKRAAIGPRVTVAIGSKKVGNQTVTLYSYMPKTVADLFGFKAVAAPKAKDRTQNGKKITGGLIRGSIGAGSIKVPIGKPTKKKNAAGKQVTVQKYRSIPVPNGATNAMIVAFLKKASKNKPDRFVSRDGRSYPVTASK
ncbi:MAG: hypothetical protein KME13_20350 [Myxacorys californica WJT36-NPBG1]|jgi:hypothetical protein|nr:hypothetical protein [Myxacorys californica WJT36-NPBG1]